MNLPNIRKLFIPDPGKVIFDVDLSGADAQVVAWEADDDDLKTAFRAGTKIHAKNAEEIFGTRFTQAAGDIKQKTSPKGRLYDQCKRAVHATNYGASSFTLARTPEIGWTTGESETFQRRWFQLHPGIKDWHRRIDRSLQQTRSVSNRFGYRIIYFDRIDQVFPEALAWVPQSTVAEVCFRGGLALESRCPYVEMLLQVHDSLVFQIPKEYHHAARHREMQEALRVVVPYDDPLVIPWGFTSSETSWGDCAPLKIAA